MHARELLWDALADLRHGGRLFLRQPAVLALTIAGLALGLGVSTAAFSIIDAAALRSEGLADPDRAPGVIRVAATSTSTTWTYDEFVALREGARLTRIEGHVSETVTIELSPAAEPRVSAAAAFVSVGFFAATGARVSLGRGLEAADDAPAAVAAVVISHHFWATRLNRAPDVIGRRLRIGHADATIVGVADRAFTLPGNRDVWLPLAAYGGVFPGASRIGAPAAGIHVFGRLIAGATLPEADAQLDGIAAGLPRDSGAAPIQIALDVRSGPGRAREADAVSTTLLVFAVIALVLILSCANVATVLVATAITREREMGVRAALGASRGRVVRQLVTESLALGGVAAVLGFLVMRWIVPLAASMVDAPANVDLSPDVRVYAFLGIVTLLTGVGAGLAPARHGRGVDIVSAIKGEARNDRTAPRRLRSILVMGQAGVSVLLLVLATLFVRATISAAQIEPGFDAGSLYAVSFGGNAVALDDGSRGEMWSRVMPLLGGVPGVDGVSLVDAAPFSGITRTSLTREEPSRTVYFVGTDASYFDVARLRLLAGRSYASDEVAARAPVAVVSESLARALWPDRSPLGELLPSTVPVAGNRPIVIGVAADAIVARLHERNALALYEPIDPAATAFAELLMRVPVGASTTNADASRRLQALLPQADMRIASVGARLDDEARLPRMLATLTGLIGCVAIFLSVIGLYGLAASLAGQRAREFAIRAALGAGARDLLRLMVWDSVRPVVLGLAAGVLTALAAARLLAATMFYGVSPQDPVAHAAAAAILLMAAVVAVLAPARTASTVDSAALLRR